MRMVIAEKSRTATRGMCGKKQRLLALHFTEQVEAEQLGSVVGIAALQLGLGDAAALDQSGEADQLAQLAAQVQAVALRTLLRLRRGGCEA